MIELSADQILAVLTGLGAVIAAVTTLLTRRAARVEIDQRSMKKEITSLQRQLLALSRHTFRLEMVITRLGGAVPPRPIDEEDDDLDYNAPAGLVAEPARRSRHAIEE